MTGGKVLGAEAEEPRDALLAVQVPLKSRCLLGVQVPSGSPGASWSPGTQPSRRRAAPAVPLRVHAHSVQSPVSCLTVLFLIEPPHSSRRDSGPRCHQHAGHPSYCAVQSQLVSSRESVLEVRATRPCYPILPSLGSSSRTYLPGGEPDDAGGSLRCATSRKRLS